jgi:hypothetical protein
VLADDGRCSGFALRARGAIGVVERVAWRDGRAPRGELRNVSRGTSLPVEHADHAVLHSLVATALLFGVASSPRIEGVAS